MLFLTWSWRRNPTTSQLATQLRASMEDTQTAYDRHKIGYRTEKGGEQCDRSRQGLSSKRTQSKELNYSLPQIINWGTPVGFPAVQCFDTPPYFLCTLELGLLQFHAPLDKLLAQSCGWRERRKGNAACFVAFGSSERRIGEWVVA